MPTKKCAPLKCPLFKAQFEKVWDKRPVDVLVVACPYREGLNCSSEKEGGK